MCSAWVCLGTQTHRSHGLPWLLYKLGLWGSLPLFADPFPLACLPCVCSGFQETRQVKNNIFKAQIFTWVSVLG